MSGMSKKLLGKFTELTIEPIKNTNAYFYNADNRNAHNIGTQEKDCKQVDDYTLEALNALFTEYKQSKVIISEGCSHIVAIADELIKKGYVADDVILSESLRKLRKNNILLHNVLTALEKNDVKTFETEIGTLSDNDEALFYLIQQPLDIHAIFEQEFANRSISLLKSHNVIIKDHFSKNQKITPLLLKHSQYLEVKNFLAKKKPININKNNYDTNKKFVHTFLQHYGSICFKKSPQLHKNVIKAVTNKN